MSKHSRAVFVVLAAALSPCGFGEETTAAVSGTVRYEGAVPRKADPDDYGQRRPMFQVNPASGGLAGAIIYLEPVDASAALPANVPDNAATMIMQRDFTFEPHLAVVPPGHTVIYGNDDPANHNVRAETENPRNAFNVITTPEQTYEKRVEAEPPRAPIRIACDVHPWMAAWVYVIEHRLFAVSDEEGAFRVADIPPGFYNVVVEQPDGGLFAETQIDVQSGAAVRLSVNFEMTQLNRQASPSVQIEIVSSAGNAAPERHKTK